MIHPIPSADDADIVEQARKVDDDIKECGALSDALGDNWDADASDLFDQKPSLSGHDHDHPPTAGHTAAYSVNDRVFWPAWESNSLGTQRSFIDDMASQNQPYRPNW